MIAPMSTTDPHNFRGALQTWRLNSPMFRYHVPKPLPRDILASADATGLLLIHVPKNGGTSVSEVLHGREYGHVPTSELAFFHPLRFRRLKKIAVIREPTSRFLSAFDYLSTGGNNPFDYHFSQKILKGMATADLFIDKVREDRRFRGHALRYFHFRPQTYYIARGGRFQVNAILRMDHLDEDLSRLLGADVLTPRANTTPGQRTHESELSTGSRRFLRNYYREDYTIWADRDDLAMSTDVYRRRIA